MENDTEKFIDNLGRYLMQQNELFGGTMYTEDVAAQKQPSSAGAAGQDTFRTNEPWVQSTSLTTLREQIHECTKCSLGLTRTKFVFGTGNEKSAVMFIGEAPGADEDAQGEPFVGRAGQLLTQIIEAVGFKRADVYICNILKCRPPNNRAPLPIESETCTPYLLKQIELVQPKFIITLGLTASQWLLQTKMSLGALRGKVHDYNGIKLIVTYHPAALLRNPAWKRPTWDDMKMFKKLYDELK